MAFFGLKLGLNLEMRAAHPHQKFQGVPPTPPRTLANRKETKATQSTNENSNIRERRQARENADRLVAIRFVLSFDWLSKFLKNQLGDAVKQINFI